MSSRPARTYSTSWNASLALWYLELDSELLFVGDAGTTEPSRPSERWGVEFNNFWALSEVWSLQVDVLNVFDSDDHDIDYFYASRLPGEAAAGVEDSHYHVFEPRQVRV